MITWFYAHGQIEARNPSGAVLLALHAAPAQAPLADILNAAPPIGRLILAGYGYHPDKRIGQDTHGEN